MEAGLAAAAAAAAERGRNYGNGSGTFVYVPLAVPGVLGMAASAPAAATEAVAPATDGAINHPMERSAVEAAATGSD
jgi:hypothetical protein